MAGITTTRIRTAHGSTGGGSAPRLGEAGGDGSYQAAPATVGDGGCSTGEPRCFDGWYGANPAGLGGWGVDGWNLGGWTLGGWTVGSGIGVTGAASPGTPAGWMSKVGAQPGASCAATPVGGDGTPVSAGDTQAGTGSGTSESVAATAGASVSAAATLTDMLFLQESGDASAISIDD